MVLVLLPAHLTEVHYNCSSSFPALFHSLSHIQTVLGDAIVTNTIPVPLATQAY